ncbi:T9SS type A sorting domain-containing protein [Hymenobacter busanensis]|uniref:T9SS type A sorting domain-containing protein n=1 Tax=Hymenobacter busanensis TaxID=2607656 RepID=A0A7L4ZX24_9BACT|nr:FG-GAP-like repeat-containing protein [Hymenobacter busanensis]KAA9325528.1 T9SS type A sorting domain-containing protein [Hymenobacter busanensis]QHJ07801.1 T9SS type A sorting domain-containing protein [Hymenobacter busanensis]
MKHYLLLASFGLAAFPALAQPTPGPIGFQATTTLQLATGAAPSDVAIGDFDHDGRPDLAVSERGLNRVELFAPGATAGSFLPAPIASVVTGASPASLVAVPLDNQPAANAADDLAVLGADQAHLQSFRNANAAGQAAFLAPASFYIDATGLYNSPRLRAGHLNGDNVIDVVTIRDGFQSSGMGVVSLYPQSMTSLGFVSTSSGGRPADVALADLNLDGELDAFYVQPQAGNVLWFFNTGTARVFSTGSAQPIPALAPTPTCVAVGNVNSQDLPDVAIGNTDNEVVLQLSRLNPQQGYLYENPLRLPVGAAPVQLLLTDLNGDSRAELVVLTAAGQLRVYRHNGGAYPACFDAPQLLPTGPDPTALRLADVDGDARPDLVVPCAGDHTVRVFRNTGQVLAAKPAAALADLQVHPNPATNRLRVQLPAGLNAAPLTATFTDALGRVLRTQAVPASGELAVDGLPRGLCLLRLHNAQGSITRRVLLQ